MKLVQFNYTKADGTTSAREVIELVTPSAYFEGIEVSELSESDFVAFTTELRALKEQQFNATQALYAKYDLRHNYRRFIPSKMENVTIDYV